MTGINNSQYGSDQMQRLWDAQQSRELAREDTSGPLGGYRRLLARDPGAYDDEVRKAHDVQSLRPNAKQPWEI
jgi:hypothetical protein